MFNKLCRFNDILEYNSINGIITLFKVVFSLTKTERDAFGKYHGVHENSNFARKLSQYTQKMKWLYAVINISRIISTLKIGKNVLYNSLLFLLLTACCKMIQILMLFKAD